jgi:hypothetical protein
MRATLRAEDSPKPSDARVAMIDPRQLLEDLFVLPIIWCGIIMTRDCIDTARRRE